MGNEHIYDAALVLVTIGVLVVILFQANSAAQSTGYSPESALRQLRALHDQSLVHRCQSWVKLRVPDRSRIDVAVDVIF